MRPTDKDNGVYDLSLPDLCCFVVDHQLGTKKIYLGHTRHNPVSFLSKLPRKMVSLSKEFIIRAPFLGRIIIALIALLLKCWSNNR